MVLSHGVSDRVMLSAALWNVPFLGSNTPLSCDLRILFQDYYLDH